MSMLRPVEAIRADFPAFESTAGEAPPARFDGPGGTQVPRLVIDAVADYLARHNANAHWHFPASERTDALVAAAREAFAAFVGGGPDEIVFGPNMTSLAMHVARGLGRQWVAGDEVVVTGLDHHANVAPWEALVVERGVVLRWWEADPETGALDLEDLPPLLSGRTRLVALGGASNALGTLSDIAATARVAHAHGALLFVDAVHLAAHRSLDVTASGADLLACSPYKFYGPHAGVLWCRRELLEAIEAPRLRPAPSTGPERLQTGTPSFEAIAGGAAAVHWLASLTDAPGGMRDRLVATFTALAAREMALFAHLWDGLGQIDGLRRFGLPPGPGRTATVSCTLAGEAPLATAARLARHGISASHGNFYALTAAERAGVHPDGWLRLGISAYTTHDEVDRALAALAAR